MITYESILAILVSLTNPKVIACVGAVLNTIANKLFLPSTITVVVIVLHSEVFNTYIST
jgi:threonine/homoserine/homoserine lactone efflux protein